MVLRASNFESFVYFCTLGGGELSWKLFLEFTSIFFMGVCPLVQ